MRVWAWWRETLRCTRITPAIVTDLKLSSLSLCMLIGFRCAPSTIRQRSLRKASFYWITWTKLDLHLPIMILHKYLFKLIFTVWLRCGFETSVPTFLPLKYWNMFLKYFCDLWMFSLLVRLFRESAVNWFGSLRYWIYLGFRLRNVSRHQDSHLQYCFPFAVLENTFRTWSPIAKDFLDRIRVKLERLVKTRGKTKSFQDYWKIFLKNSEIS